MSDCNVSILLQTVDATIFVDAWHFAFLENCSPMESTSIIRP